MYAHRLALAVLALAGPAAADSHADPDFAGPFAYAESHHKAEDRAAAEASDSAGRVIGGQLAAEGAWPWQVALLIKGEPVGPDAQFCGGSLVLDDWVLTAAHCIHMPDDSGTFRDIPADRIQVLAGSNVLAPGRGDLIDVVGIYRHPDYVGTLFDFDIALVKLARAPRVAYQTITVPDAAFGTDLDQPGVPTIVTGWGLVNGGGHPAEMYQTEIQVMAREMCNEAIMEARASAASEGFLQATQTLSLTDEATDEVWAALMERAPLPLSDNMICSGSFEGGKTSCQGDSGGPLVVPLDDGTYIQAGVVSWGLSAAAGTTCAEDAPFSAYTKISNFVPWLESTINAN
jgi:secreted trypsin-like serine protease